MTSIERAGGSQDPVVAFVDTAGIHRAGSNVRFALERRYARVESGRDRLRARIEVDCATRRWRSEESAFYLGDRETARRGPIPFAPSGAASSGFATLEAVCAGHYLTGPVDPVAYARSLFEAR